MFESSSDDGALPYSLNSFALTVTSAAVPCILAAAATAPKQLPQNMSTVNQPYSSHTRFLSSSSSLHHRKNIVPPAATLAQNPAICTRNRQRRQQQPRMLLKNSRFSP